MLQLNKPKRFDDIIAVHINAAYNLARWLTKNDHDAEDVVQESFVRAYQFYGGFRGGDSRAWLMRIVRNTCYTWLDKNKAARQVEFNCDEHINAASDDPTPEAVLLRNIESQILKAAIEQLPPEFREILILRDLEDLSYKEIAEIVSIPIGTVMSRLARARKRVAHSISAEQELTNEL